MKCVRQGTDYLDGSLTYGAGSTPDSYLLYTTAHITDYNTTKAKLIASRGEILLRDILVGQTAYCGLLWVEK